MSMSASAISTTVRLARYHPPVGLTMGNLTTVLCKLNATNGRGNRAATAKSAIASLRHARQAEDKH